ncbi:patatin-like phospholipase family protein [Salinimicrobium xinjiangense]|uniref:patatin-like phospholipase family protein n=1 Tax=Salinimicrobium xinjiangense TaxID=438596 RepID=UPI0021D1B9ED|nr:patatin-like phospholipase family protein [Salinimicrobium xinjiangense]
MSGGSARGYAHVGVLKALHEHGIEPTIISGTSMGAVVGVLYAAGYSPGGIRKILIEETFSRMTGFSWRRTGLYKLEKMKLALEKYIPEDNFSALKKPFYLGLSNLNEACGEIKQEGPLFDYLIASCSVPGIFAPIVLDEVNYVDGGLMCNLPASPIRDKCKYLIGSHVNFAGKKKVFTGPRGILERSINLGITQNAKPQMELCDFVIDPPEMQNFSLFDFSRIEEIIEIGYSHTIKMIEAGELPVGKLKTRSNKA